METTSNTPEGTAAVENMTNVIVIGKESVGKSQLITSITGEYSDISNFRGTTISCETYEKDSNIYIDTPGLLLQSDSETAKITLSMLDKSDKVLLVVNGTHIDEDLRDLLPIVKGKEGSIVVTYHDKIKDEKDVNKKLSQLEKELSTPMVAIDARNLTDTDIHEITESIQSSSTFTVEKVKGTGWKIEPPGSIFDIPVLGQIMALAAMFVPAWLAVQNANKLADLLFDPLTGLLKPFLESVNHWPGPLNFIFGKTYGFVSMGPFLLLYALPTVIIFSFILSLYKTTGLIDRLTIALNPVMRPLGITGRGLARIIMGFGCNVPAIINTRSCSSSSRGQTICAISFGAACSYQLPATLSVFAAAKMPHLGLVYLLILAVTSILFLRITTPREFNHDDNRLLIEGRDFLQWPRISALVRELWLVLKQFIFMALPVFFLICIIAAIFEWLGLMQLMGTALAPVMKVFNLPGETSLPVILASVRKDGIMLLAKGNMFKTLSQVQVLTAVYLSGILFPCVVSLLTIIKEMKAKFTIKLLLKQALGAVIFAILIAWTGKLLFG